MKDDSRLTAKGLTRKSAHDHEVRHIRVNLRQLTLKVAHFGQYWAFFAPSNEFLQGLTWALRE